MSTAAALSPDSQLSGVLRRLRWIDTGIDRLQVEVDGPGVATSADISGIDRAIRRLESAKLALVAKAERQRVHTRTGDASTSAWLAGATKAGGASASGQVALATALTSMPLTREALASGTVSTANARIVVAAVEQLPESISSSEKELVEQALVRDASRLDPGRLRRAATLALAAAGRSAQESAEHQERVLSDRERRAYAASTLTLHDNEDGTTTGRFTVPTLAAHILKKVVDSMSAPRRDHLRSARAGRGPLGASPAGSGADTASAAAGGSNGDTSAGNADGRTASSADEGPDDSAGARLRARDADWAELDWAQKRGRALVAILEHLPTEALTGRVASSVVVTMTVEQVLAAAAAATLGDSAAATGHGDSAAATGHGGAAAIGHRGAGESARHGGATAAGHGGGATTGATSTDTRAQLSTSEARRIACNAGLLPAVLGGASVPVDLGRERRLFSESQRTALAAVHDECAAEGCDRPYAWCELHHANPWSSGGRTDLRDAIPLCGWHHRHLHDPQVRHRIDRSSGAGAPVVRFSRRN
jgi:hypothetical protein